MLALALFIAAGAPNAARALLDARAVTRGSFRRLSTANFEELKLVAADAAAGDEFGTSVAIDGDTVVIGAPGAGTGGAVYVLRTTDGGATYGQVAKLTASDAALYDEFGSSVAIAGGTVVVGTSAKDSYTGAVYVFRTTDGGATYAEVAKLTAADAASGDDFGISVAIAGDTIVVGTENKEAAYVFRTTDGGATYGQVAKLTASDAAAGDVFGSSVAIDGETIVVGAYGENFATGAAYVFRTTDGGATYGQVAKLTAADAAYDYFGYSMAIDGNTIVVGAYVKDNWTGAAYVFRTTDGGATYDQVAKLTADDAAASDYFGYSVAIDGGTVVVGSFGDDDAGSYSGSAYVFLTTDGGATYDQVAKLTASDAAAGDFGGSVAIAGSTIVVGAYSGSGSAYVFPPPAPTAQPTPRPTWTFQPTPQPTISPKPTTPQPTTPQPTTPQPTPEPSTAALGSDAATRAGGTFLALLVATVLAL